MVHRLEGVCMHVQRTCLYRECVSLCTLKHYLTVTGMMIENVAVKSASVHGLCQDASPFAFSEDMPAVDYFGQLLFVGERFSR